MARRRHPRLTPLDLYEAYPDADILPLDPPDTTTTWLSFGRRFDPGPNCADSLFKFLVHELAEEGLPIEEAYRRLRIAHLDILAVRLRCDLLLEGKLDG